MSKLFDKIKLGAKSLGASAKVQIKNKINEEIAIRKDISKAKHKEIKTQRILQARRRIKEKYNPKKETKKEFKYF